jgi:hypothetical protein
LIIVKLKETSVARRLGVILGVVRVDPLELASQLA